jgi:hypothetical protein
MRRSILETCIGVASVIFGGCVTKPTVDVGPDHPANAEAADIGLPAQSTMLAISSPTPVTNRAGEKVADTLPTTPAHEHHTGHDAQAATQPTEMQAPTPAAEVKLAYTCPMHPEVVSDQPGRCPKCKMKLVKKGASK